MFANSYEDKRNAFLLSCFSFRRLKYFLALHKKNNIALSASFIVKNIFHSDFLFIFGKSSNL